MDRTDPTESEIVEKLGLEKAPVPLVLAIAPNGAVTGSIKAADLSEERLLGAVASAGLQQCLKAVQDGQLVLLCLQNAQTRDNDSAMKGVKDIKADQRFAEGTEIIKLDPADAKEAKLMAQLKVDPKTKKAVTVVLAPPGVLVTKFDGTTTKKELMAALQKAAECCSGAPGCCSPAQIAPPAPAMKIQTLVWREIFERKNQLATSFLRHPPGSERRRGDEEHHLLLGEGGGLSA